MMTTVLKRMIMVALVGVGIMTTAPAAEAARGESREIPKLTKAPVIDGDLSEWKQTAWFDLVTPKWMSTQDLSARVWLAWDAGHLYMAVKVTDDKQFNQQTAEKGLYSGDQIRLWIGATPDKQGSKKSTGDVELMIAPTSASGAAAATWKLVGKPISVLGGDGAVSGIRWASKLGTKAYTVEAVMPIAALGRKAPLVTGDDLSFVLAVFDRDTEDPAEWKQTHMRISSSDVKKQPREWPLLKLAETVDIPVAPVAVAQKQIGGFKIGIVRQKPCNYFSPETPITFDVGFRTPITGKCTGVARVKDYFSKTVLEKKITFESEKGRHVVLPVELGVLPRGYYTLDVIATLKGEEGEVGARQRATLGVMDLVSRTAKEVRDGDYRLGLKMSYLGKAWWHYNAEWDEKEVLDSTCKLGLQWTRALLQQGGDPSTEDLMKQYPMNVIMKVERFPAELYDTETYGPMKAWEAANRRGEWTLKTLPREADYKAWLREELKKVPVTQNVFEIWNEAWDKMTAEDLAKISQWIASVILSERPDAIIGPNLTGKSSKYEYDAAFIKAGGMKGMKMVALHPYSGSEDRQWMRDYKVWLKEQTGRDIDVYVTEYGSHSCPEGPSKQSENFQAQQVVRQTLALYAEDVKAMTPHLMGQREENRKYHEHWFGHYRLNHEPKPVLYALANCARMIDGSRYVGDLWYGPGVGAMVFETSGVYTLALWTRGEAKNIQVEPGVTEVTLVNMVGTETPTAVTGGALSLTVSPDVTYVRGIFPALAKQASKVLKPERWPVDASETRNERTAVRFVSAPELTGNFDAWEHVTQMAIVNPKVNGNDASGVAYLGWDADYLYVGLDMRDDQIMNTQPDGTLYREDSMELFISSEVRDIDPGYGPHDHQFFVSPVSRAGDGVLVEVLDPSNHKTGPVAGARTHIAKSNKGWVAQVAFPWSAFPGFKAYPGAQLALEMRVNDADKSHARWKLDPPGIHVRFADPTVWSILILGE